MEAALNGGIAVVLIGQGLLNFLTNIDRIELVVFSSFSISYTSEFVASIKLD